MKYENSNSPGVKVHSEIHEPRLKGHKLVSPSRLRPYFHCECGKAPHTGFGKGYRHARIWHNLHKRNIRTKNFTYKEKI